MAVFEMVSFFAVINFLRSSALLTNGFEEISVEPIPQTVGQPWPMPMSYSSLPDLYNIDSKSFQFIATGQHCDDLYKAFVRYRSLTFGLKSEALKFRPPKRLPTSETITKLNVNQKNPCDAYLSLESDESYTLTVNISGAWLLANSLWGALRGLETFSQIVYQLDDGTFVVNKTKISDSPRFKHRGLLLDTSRHYLSLETLKQNLDAMAQVKFNVFHWHIVDHQSFPYQSLKFPDMSKKGAYDIHHVYSQADIKEIIEYARLRGIRVIPEFDTPGHSLSWGKAILDLLTKCCNETKFDGTYGPIDPSLETTYDFLTKFFTELSEVFPDHYMHLGGDEVPFSCWQSNPNITVFMQKMGYGKDYAKLEEYYMQNLIKIVNKLNKGYMIWQDVIDNGATVRPDTVVEVWKTKGYPKELEKVTKLGYQTILASCWYLSHIHFGIDWKQYYLCDPHNFNGTAKQKQLVVGGEACMWGEFVDDTNLISRTWPHASVVAERLWSPIGMNDMNAVVPRLEEHRCRMVRRHFAAESLNGPGFCKTEFVPGY